MSKHVPFTAYIRVVPSRGTGKRLEYWRDLQKIAKFVYDNLEDDSDLTLAKPGGGQHISFSGVGSGGWGGLANGTAIKPQIGESPAQLMITGFYSLSSSTSPVHPDKPVLHTGSYETGVGGAHGWSANPTSSLDTDAKNLKSKIESAVTSVSVTVPDWYVYRLDIAGVIYGDRGFHFPR